MCIRDSFRSDAKFITINTSRFDAYKLGAVKLVADAKLGIIALGKALSLSLIHI